MAEGAIAQRARAQIPQTWDKLANSTLYGPSALQQRIDYIKYSLFSTLVDQAYEATTYNPVVLDYAAKLVALQVIPPGIDYWSSIRSGLTKTGSQEAATFPDKIAALERVYARLWAEVQDMQGTVVPAVLKRTKIPQINTTDDFRTDDPNKFPKQSRCGRYIHDRWGGDYPFTLSNWE